MGCPILGFKDHKAYIDEAQSAGKLHRILIPTFILNSMDDPMCPSNVLPFEECRNCENVLLATTKSGTHAGHLEGSSGSFFLRPRQWFTKPAGRFFDYLETTVHGNDKFRSSLPSTKHASSTSPLEFFGLFQAKNEQLGSRRS